MTIDAFSVRAFGASIGVRVAEDAIIATLLERLPDGARVEAFHAGDEVVAVGDAGGAPLSARLELFDSQLRFAIAQHARDAVAIHAGAVGWRGHAALFPGRSFAGKSTLTAALIAAGADYVTDEHAMLDESGRVLPWFKPLSLRDARFAQESVAPQAFGARFADAPLPVALVLSTRYAQGARFAPAPLTRSLGALALFDNAIAAQLAPQRVMQAVVAAAAGALCYRSDRAEAQEIARPVLALLEQAIAARFERPEKSA